MPTSSVVAGSAVRAAVTLLSFASFFSGAALRICDGLLVRLATDFDITAGTAGQVVITFAVAYGISQLVFGPLGDRYGKARIMCTALFGSAIASLMCAMAPGFDALVRLRAVWGLTAAGVIPLAIAWVGDAVPYDQRQATLARLMLGTLGGMTAGQLAGGLFADTPLGWRGAFMALSAGYLVVSGLLFARLRTIPSAPQVRHEGRFTFLAQLASVCAIPWARVVVLTVGLEGLLMFGPLAFLPAYIHHRFGVPLSSASALIAPFAVGGFVYALMAKGILQRVGESRMVLAGGVVMGLGFLCWYLAPVAWLAAPIAFATGFGTYLLHNTLQTNGSQMAPQTRGTAMALFAFSLFVGQAGGAAMAAWAYDHAGAAALLLVPAALLPLVSWNFARGLVRRA